ncbi:D-amino acid aminotransferase [Alloalcanivorax xenomutans]|uniref:D-amino acid aminotransferase n=1 Tax=Alloalcanivorax xenomutans TaxID=1094342 RepID=UPI001F375C11|nr:D-amino acid aminotransferase [Alloalcanivorax xenomutans]MCE7522196.1 D-amino acid aminotransferase [Alloalcanivorax xenomutans]
MSTVYLNGAFMAMEQARISPMDRGFLFADGVYEVIPAFNGVLFRFEEHLRRLERSLSALYLINPHDRAGWCRRCEELIQRNGGGNLSLYLQITRGAADKRDHAFPDPPVSPTVFMSTAPLTVPTEDSPDRITGAAAITLDDIRWARCDIKSISLLPNILLRQQAIAVGAREAILIHDGFVTEGAASNVFIVKDGEIATPPASHAILGGITRDLVIELCREQELPLREREISEAELGDADEVWISSSTRDVVPVVSLDGRPVGSGRPGETWKILARHYIAFKRRLCGV